MLIIFGTHNLQTFKHNTLINELLLMQFYLFNIRPKLHCLKLGVFWIILSNVIKIDPYNFELYRFKVCTFFSETQYRNRLLMKLMIDWKCTGMFSRYRIRCWWDFHCVVAASVRCLQLLSHSVMETLVLPAPASSRAITCPNQQM